MGYWVLKAVLTPVFFLLYRVRVEGRQNVPRHGPAVLAANHRSFCDSFFLPLVLRRRVTFLAKAEYFDSPRTAWFFRAAGQIPIRREGGDAAERALETAREVLAAGQLLAIYPEGTRTMDGFVHKGRTGVARLSRECGVPVIPVGLEGTDEVQPVDKVYMRPFRTVTVRFGEPMRMPVAADPDDPFADHDHTVCRDFTDDLMRRIADLARRHYVDEYVPKRKKDAGREQSGETPTAAPGPVPGESPGPEPTGAPTPPPGALGRVAAVSSTPPVGEPAAGPASHGTLPVPGPGGTPGMVPRRPLAG